MALLSINLTNNWNKVEAYNWNTGLSLQVTVDNYTTLNNSFVCLFLLVTTSNHSETDYKNKDWVFINYTYKRFEGLTARGAIPSYMKTGK